MEHVKPNDPMSQMGRWSGPWRDGAFGLLVAGVAALPFLPALRNGFVLWDDPETIVSNPHIRGFEPVQIRWMFTTCHMGPYQPLSWLSLAGDYAVWGLNPFGFHLTSLLIHMAAAVWFYIVCRRLLRHAADVEQVDGSIAAASAFSALLFATHPLRVESVVWATERRDVLCGLWAMATLWAYVHAAERHRTGRPRGAWLAAAVLLFVLSLLSKAAAMGLPAVLSVLDFYPLRRLGPSRPQCRAADQRAIWLEKLPFWMLSAAAGAVALHGQRASDALSGLDQLGIADRLAIASYGAVFYLGKTLLPIGLSPLYELPHPMNKFQPRFMVAALVVVGLTVVLVRARRRLPAGLAAWICYLALLAPVSGLAQSGVQIAADRYTYLPCLGLALLAGGGLWQMTRGVATRTILAPWMAVGLGTLVVAAISTLTAVQTRIWRSTEALWARAIRLDPSSSMVHNHFGRARAAAGRLESASALLAKAIRLNPANWAAHNNLGIVLRRLGEAVPALEHYATAARLAPRAAEVRFNAGLLLAESDWIESLGFRDAAAQWQAAVEWCDQAIALQPDYADAFNGRGIAWKKLGRTREAATSFEQAVRIDPQHIAARFNWASIADDDATAVSHYRQILTIDPTHAATLYQLAWRRAASPHEAIRDGTEAVRLCERLRQQAGSTPELLDLLAAARAEAGQYESAASTARQAAQLAKQQGASQLAAEIEGRAALYDRALPYRRPSSR
jgi:tetratricopeptide (TPR) repeat protein